MLKREVIFTAVFLTIAVWLMARGLRPRTETYVGPDGTVIVLQERCTRILLPRGTATTCQMVKVEPERR